MRTFFFLLLNLLFMKENARCGDLVTITLHDGKNIDQVIKVSSVKDGLVIRKFKYQDVVNYLHRLNEKGLSGGHRTRELSGIKVYFDYLFQTGQRKDHPCRRLRIKDYRQKGVNFEQLLSMDELQMLMNREERYRLLILRNKVITSLLIYQGLTSEEITRLDLENINLDNATVYIKASRKLNRRTLELHRTQPVIISRYLEESRPGLVKCNTQSLIITHRGVPETVDGIHSMIEPLKAMVPYKVVSPKNIRLSVISYWLNERKFPLEQVQLMAGHKWPSTTERYLRQDTEKQRQRINQFHPLG